MTGASSFPENHDQDGLAISQQRLSARVRQACRPRPESGTAGTVAPNRRLALCSQSRWYDVHLRPSPEDPETSLSGRQQQYHGRTKTWRSTRAQADPGRKGSAAVDIPRSALVASESCCVCPTARELCAALTQFTDDAVSTWDSTASSWVPMHVPSRALGPCRMHMHMQPHFRFFRTTNKDVAVAATVRGQGWACIGILTSQCKTQPSGTETWQSWIFTNLTQILMIRVISTILWQCVAMRMRRGRPVDDETSELGSCSLDSRLVSLSSHIRKRDVPCRLGAAAMRTYHRSRPLPPLCKPAAEWGVCSSDKRLLISQKSTITAPAIACQQTTRRA